MQDNFMKINTHYAYIILQNTAFLMHMPHKIMLPACADIQEISFPKITLFLFPIFPSTYTNNFITPLGFIDYPTITKLEMNYTFSPYCKVSVAASHRSRRYSLLITIYNSYFRRSPGSCHHYMMRHLGWMKIYTRYAYKLVRCYVWSIALYGSETWTLRKLERK